MLFSAGSGSTEKWMVLSSWAMKHKEGMWMWHTSYSLKGTSDMERDAVTYKIAVQDCVTTKKTQQECWLGISLWKG